MELTLIEKKVTIQAKDCEELQKKAIIEVALSLRQLLKNDSQFSLADQIRDNLRIVGVFVTDMPDGSYFYKIKPLVGSKNE